MSTRTLFGIGIGVGLVVVLGLVLWLWPRQPAPPAGAFVIATSAAPPVGARPTAAAPKPSATRLAAPAAPSPTRAEPGATPTIAPIIAVTGVDPQTIDLTSLPARMTISGTGLDGLLRAALIGPAGQRLDLELVEVGTTTAIVQVQALPEEFDGSGDFSLHLNDRPEPAAILSLRDYLEVRTVQGVDDAYEYTQRIGADQAGPFTRMRSIPKLDGERRAVLRNGDVVAILSSAEPGWYRVRIQTSVVEPERAGSVGWIERWLVDNQDLPPTPAPTATRAGVNFIARTDVSYPNSGNSGNFRSCVQGRVSGQGRVYPNAVVNVNNGPSNTYTTTTGADGIYTVCGLGASTWSVVLRQVPGLQLSRQVVGTFYVNGGDQAAVVNFVQQ